MEVKMTKVRERYPVDFLKFYDAYPRFRRAGYVKPYQSWQRLIKEGRLPSIDVILDSIEKSKQLEQWQQDGGRYVPHMTTWLNQCRWESEVVNHAQVVKEEWYIADNKVQQEENNLWLEMRQNKVEKDTYNAAKFTIYPTDLLYNVFYFFEYNAITLYINTDSMFPRSFAVIDAIHDLVGIKFRGEEVTLEDASSFVTNFQSTVIAIVACRYCDASGVDAIQGLSFSEAECLILRKVLCALTTPKVCVAYRERYKVRAILPCESWLMAFSVDNFLAGLQEVL